MDYQAIVKSMKKLACVISVKQEADGTLGTPCIEAANDLYLQSVNVAPENFVPGRPYSDYIYKDHNFEILVAKCIGEDKLVHTYVNAERYNGWMDIYIMPLVSEREDTGYALFSYDMTPNADSEKLSDVTAQAAMQVIKTSVKLRESSDFKTKMQAITDDIRLTCKAKRCAVLLTDFKTRTFSILAHSVENNDLEKKMEDYLDDSFFNLIETWEKLIAGSNCYLIQNERDMEEVKTKSKDWYDSMVVAGVKNLALYPLRVDGETIGFIWAINFDEENTLSIKQILEVTTFLLAAEVNNHRLYKQMERLSVTDLLTNIYNRNAMNNKITDIVNGKYTFGNPYGIVFIDMNGLKTVNDKEGHLAGDNLLKAAANVLKETFKGCDIFRVGGDEFLIIVEDKKEDEFNALIEKVRDISEHSDTMKFAIGTCFEEPSFDIRKAMHIADENMYKDKEEFYKNNPDIARRESDN